MNDPHVETLYYRVEHDDSLDYTNADPMEHDDNLTHVEISGRQVTIRPKEHYATVEEAKAAVEPFVRQWEFGSTLESGSRAFTLRFSTAEVIDLNPLPDPPGVIRANAGPIVAHVTISTARGRVGKKSYPNPPSGPVLNPDAPEVIVMLARLDRYHQRRTTLPDTANFCLTVLEDSVLDARGRRRQVSREYNIAMEVLDRVGNLASTKGGPLEARKGSGHYEDYTREERDFLVDATRAFIRRAAEKAANPEGIFKEITRGNLADF